MSMNNPNAATPIDETVQAQVETDLRRRILRAFVGRGLLQSCDAKDMPAYQHSGFSVDAGVCIQAHDRAALERLLRYCARPPFAMERLRKDGAALVYRCAKQHSEPAGDKRGAKVDELTLTPLELIARIAAAQLAAAQAQSATTGEGAPGVAPLGSANPTQPEPVEAVPPKRSPAHYLWAVLIARLYEVFPLRCPLCAGQMRIIAFITHRADIRQILDPIGVDSRPTHISPARGPPLWAGCNAQMDDGAQIEPDWAADMRPAALANQRMRLFGRCK